MLTSSPLVLPSELSDARRPVRLRLGRGAEVVKDHLMVKRLSSEAAMCGSFEYRLLCVASRAGLPLKSFAALAAEVQFVTDRGGLHSVCGIVARADEGESDGGLATYQLVIRDALALMESRVNTRVFHCANEVDITRTLLTEWTRQQSGACPRVRLQAPVDRLPHAGIHDARQRIRRGFPAPTVEAPWSGMVL